MSRFIPLAILIVANVLVWSYAFPAQELRVSFFDVGQGDAIFITGPTGVQMLIDGGSNAAVLRELGDAVPFFDRTLDAVVATHPDKDHIGGLSDVVSRYDIAFYIESGVKSDTSASRALDDLLVQRDVESLTAHRGMRFVLGGGAYADVLFPDRDVRNLETNTSSVIMKILYGETTFLLTGDSPSSIEQYLVTLDGQSLQSDVLKAGHHGSKTSSSEVFVDAVMPRYVVISRGCDNSYGHPHAEVIEKIQAIGARLLDTCTDGTITFSSNGAEVSL